MTYSRRRLRELVELAERDDAAALRALQIRFVGELERLAGRKLPALRRRAFWLAAVLPDRARGAR
jgi:hypothetical protein